MSRKRESLPNRNRDSQRFQSSEQDLDREQSRDFRGEPNEYRDQDERWSTGRSWSQEEGLRERSHRAIDEESYSNPEPSYGTNYGSTYGTFRGISYNPSMTSSAGRNESFSNRGGQYPERLDQYSDSSSDTADYSPRGSFNSRDDFTNRGYGSNHGNTGYDATYGNYGNRPPDSQEERPQVMSNRPEAYYGGRGPKSYKRTDERIKEDVCDLLTRNHYIDAHDIDVDVKDGEVILSGSVPNRRMKHLAEDVAEQCYSVKDVVNNIRVKRDEVSIFASDKHSSEKSGGKKSSEPPSRH